MISAGEFRKGITFEMNGEPHVILDFQHVKPGKGSPFVRTKYKNILTGATREEAFNPNDKFPKAHIETKKMQYLYNDGELYYFMDNDTFDQIPLHHDQVEEALKYLRENDDQIAVNAADVGDTLKFVKENEMVKILSYEGDVFGIEPPLFVELEITETEPGFAGNTATGATKPATVETGLVIQVPLFIESGERVQIDTRTGEYLGRSKE